MSEEHVMEDVSGGAATAISISDEDDMHDSETSPTPSTLTQPSLASSKLKSRCWAYFNQPKEPSQEQTSIHTLWYLTKRKYTFVHMLVLV